jgi:HlyD family secretion protein
MKRTTWITGATVSVAAVALVGWAFAPRPLDVELATPPGPVRDHARRGRPHAAGRPLRRVGPAGRPRLARITLREGDEVKAGDVLARLQPALTPLLDERSRREQPRAWKGAGRRAAGRQAHGGCTRGAGARARRPARSEQLAQQGFIAPTKLTATGCRCRRRRRNWKRRPKAHMWPATTWSRRAWRWAWCARRPRRRCLRTARPVSGRVLKVHHQRGHGGAGRAADRDRRRVAAGGGGRTADQRRLAGAARQRRAHRTLGRAGGAAGPRAAASSRRPSPRCRRWAWRSSAST